MFSFLIVALFALISLSVSESRPLRGTVSSLLPCDLPTANATLTPSFVSSTPSLPKPTTDNCSEPTTTTATATPVPLTSLTPPPIPTSAAPTTSVVSTPATSSAPVSTPAVLTTVSDVSSGTYTGGYATYFYQNGNPGACGQVNSDYAYICAMDQTRFGTNGPASPLCGQRVQITNDNTGGSITVTIADDCPTCNNENSIDLSVGAFQALAPLSEGIFPITWSIV